MGCQIHSSNPQIPCRVFKKKPPYLFPFSSVQPKLRIPTIPLSSSYNDIPDQEPIPTSTVTQTQVSKTSVNSVKFKTLDACKLGISRYPDFEYNAEGGKGTGNGKKIVDKDFSFMSVDFDVKTLFIPPLTTATTKFLGLPLPPFLKIDIVPEILRGSIDQESGKVDLNFKAKFWFSVGSIYKAPPLLVETLLTSEESKGNLRSGRGVRLDEEGRCRLVGVATVEPIEDFLMNSFLSLPTECLAELSAIIIFSQSFEIS